MAFFSAGSNKVAGGFRARLRRYFGNRRGNIGVLTALLIVPLVGVMGVAGETGSWFFMQRGMQNAADAAVLAISTTADTGAGAVAHAQAEGSAVAASYGFVSGPSTVIVSKKGTVPAPKPKACLDNPCYYVSITRKIPLFLIQVLGYPGNATLNGGPAESVSARAVAVGIPISTSYCVLSLGPGAAFQAAGALSTVNFNGCYVRTNADVNCDTDPNPVVGFFGYTGINSNCSPDPGRQLLPLTDPYSARAASLANTCGAYAPILLAGPLTVNPGDPHRCGDVRLSGDLNLTASAPGAALVIEGGTLDLNGHKLTAVGVPIIFSGVPIGSSQYPTNSSSIGTLDISAPTSGAWSGVAVYQNPSIAAAPITYDGINLRWNITGLIYLPNASLTFSGTVQPGSSGGNCFVVVDYTMTATGNGTIYPNTLQGCTIAGLTPPTDGSLLRAQLVQ